MQPFEIKQVQLGKVESYSLRFTSIGWAEIVLDERGLFYCQSDWGNYVHWWSAYAVKEKYPDMQEFKRFLTNINWDYFIDKTYQGQRVLNEKDTKNNLTERIIRKRRDCQITKEEARTFVDWVKEADLSDVQAGSVIICNYDELMEEIFNNDTYAMGECFRLDWPEYAKHFAQVVFPLFQKYLKQELSLG